MTTESTTTTASDAASVTTLLPYTLLCRFCDSKILRVNAAHRATIDTQSVTAPTLDAANGTQAPHIYLHNLSTEGQLPSPNITSSPSTERPRNAYGTVYSPADYWVVTDQFDFDNVGVTKDIERLPTAESTGDGHQHDQQLVYRRAPCKLLTCADCDRGPIGITYLDNSGRFYVVEDRCRVVHE